MWRRKFKLPSWNFCLKYRGNHEVLNSISQNLWLCITCTSSLPLPYNMGGEGGRGEGGRGWGYTFLITPMGFSIFFTLPLEILDKTKLHPWIFHKIVLDPVDSWPKRKTPGNSTLSFLVHPWKFHFVFN